MGHLEQQRREQQLDGCDVGPDADQIGDAEARVPDHPDVVGLGDRGEQLHLGADVRVLDVDAPGADRTSTGRRPSGIEECGVDRVPRHQLLRLGRQRLGLVRELGRFGLGEQAADPAQRAVVAGSRGPGGTRATRPPSRRRRQERVDPEGGLQRAGEAEHDPPRLRRREPLHPMPGTDHAGIARSEGAQLGQLLDPGVRGPVHGVAAPRVLPDQGDYQRHAARRRLPSGEVQDVGRLPAALPRLLQRGEQGLGGGPLRVDRGIPRRAARTRAPAPSRHRSVRRAAGGRRATRRSPCRACCPAIPTAVRVGCGQRSLSTADV